MFALSVFAQFSAGQILARALGSRSSLLGFNLTPCPQRLKGKKRERGEGEGERINGRETVRGLSR